MKLLRLPRVFFNRVAYAGNRALVSLDYAGRSSNIRVWRLDEDSAPVTITSRQGYSLWILLQPGGEALLRRHGLWPAGAELPAAVPTDLELGHPLNPFPGASMVLAAASPDGATVVYERSGYIESHYRTLFHLRQPDGSVHDLYRANCTFGARAAISPDGRLAALSAGDCVVAVWDLVEPREVCRFQQSDSVLALAFVANGRLAVSAGRTVRIWDVAEARELLRFPSFRSYADGLAVSPDYRLLLAGSRSGIVRMWEPGTGREVSRHDWGVRELQHLAFAPDGSTAAAAGKNTLVVWDLD
jgi:WD40 repeat protein